jgi:hypothetical protein
VYFGEAAEVNARTQEVLDRAYRLHPERCVSGLPVVEELPAEMWTNRDDERTGLVMSTQYVLIRIVSKQLTGPVRYQTGNS